MKNCCSIFLTFYFILYVSCQKDNGVDHLPANRTVIVYMAADNDLSDDAWDNVKEMENGYVENGTNLIVFIDPADDAPHVLQIVQGGKKRIKTYPEFNSADAEKMKTVLNDITGMFPAPGYGLVLWSHGTSWMPAGVQLRSFAEDNGRQMNIKELADALPVHFDFILLDACLMGSVEVAYELRNKTDYIVASPTDIMYTGFPYEQIIPELLPTEPYLKKAAEIYFNYYDQLPGAFRSASISLIKTSELEQLAITANQLITDRTFDSDTFDRTSVQRLDLYEGQYTFDFLDFMEKAFPDENLEPLKEQLCKTVLYSEHTPTFIGQYEISTCCGLSCYIPADSDVLNEFYRQLDWCGDSGFYQLFR